MAKRKTKKKSPARRQKKASLSARFEAPALGGGLDGPPDAQNVLAEPTGRRIITVLEPGAAALRSALSTIRSSAGLADVCHAKDFDLESYSAEQADRADALVLDELGIIVVNGDQDQQLAAEAAAPGDAGIVVEPEYWNYPLVLDPRDELAAGPLGPRGSGSSMPLAPAAPAASSEFLLGYRSGVNDMVAALLSGGGAAPDIAAMDFEDTAASTWGLLAHGVVQGEPSGEGIRVAVLDTGMDLEHPDFQARELEGNSFVPESEDDHEVQDRNGHGTHCIGTSCGPLRPGVGPRYGVAWGASIFAGKVLAHNAQTGRASGADGWILDGINWALRSECEIVSMSLGAPVSGPGFPTSYERAASRALELGTLIIAAAGNDSNRARGIVRPVSRPANCPSIAAVAAVDSRLRVAGFSNGQQFGDGGEINLSGAGVRVLSSVPMPERTGLKSGTSMATPHVAGLAALVAFETGLRGLELYRELRRRAQPLGERRDFGNGLARL